MFEEEKPQRRTFYLWYADTRRKEMKDNIWKCPKGHDIHIPYQEDFNNWYCPTCKRIWAYMLLTKQKEGNE